MERILPADLESWKDEKRQGPGRDPRVLPIVRTARDFRFVTLRDALCEMRAAATAPDWPFRGPSASAEVLEGIVACGEDLASYHEYWLRVSGASPESSASMQHRAM
eukprot:1228536-Lingulodinium_polyedra.AAC.1